MFNASICCHIPWVLYRCKIFFSSETEITDAPFPLSQGFCFVCYVSISECLHVSCLFARSILWICSFNNGRFLCVALCWNYPLCIAGQCITNPSQQQSLIFMLTRFIFLRTSMWLSAGFPNPVKPYFHDYSQRWRGLAVYVP